MSARDKEDIRNISALFLGFFLGLFAFLYVGYKMGFIHSFMISLKERDLAGLNDLLVSHLSSFILVFLVILVFIYILSLFLKKQKRKYNPLFLAICSGILLGFWFFLFFIYMCAVAFWIMRGIWMIVSIINPLFQYVSLVLFCIIGFIFETVLGQTISAKAWKEETYENMFTGTILFFMLLPYAFGAVVCLLEKVLNKLLGNNEQLPLKILKILSIDVLRYATYIFAFFTYMLGDLLEKIPDDSSFTAIKEGLLAFLIIDVVFYGIYSDFSKRKNRDLIRVLRSLSTELERVQNMIIANNLTQYKYHQSKIKLSVSLINELDKYAKKRNLDESISFIHSNIKEISKGSTETGLSFEELYDKINQIQRAIQRYLDEGQR